MYKLNFNVNGELIPNQLYLANPQKTYVGMLSGVKEFKPTLALNELSELSFKIYKYANGKLNKYYDDIEPKRLIEVQNMGWFQIQKAPEINDGSVSYKNVTINSLENELVGKRIDDIDGVFGLYNITDQDHSILHICARASGWNIGHVSQDLISKLRTFSIDTAKVYNLLTNEVAKSFDCVFIFNTYDKTINAYTNEDIGEVTDIFISNKNLLQQYTKESNADNIVTKLRVIGGNGLDIREVNPTLNNTLINIEYYKKWMSVSLSSSWDIYQTKYNNLLTSYNILISTRKLRENELATLKSELVNLEGLKKAQDEIVGSYVTLYNTITPNTPNYSSYLAAVNASSSYVIQIAGKKSQIVAKELQITTVKNQISDFSRDLSLSTNFTQAQLQELEPFLTEGDIYEDSTFSVTDIMTEQQKIDMQLELMANGAKELAKASQPQYVFEIEASNLFSIVDDKTRKLSYQKWKEKLQVGNFITLKLYDDYWITVRVLKIELDYDRLDYMKLTLSNKTRLDDSKDIIGELLATTSKTSSLSLNKYGYDQAASITNEVREFMNGSFNATLNMITTNDNQEMYFDNYGLHGRKWLSDQNKYSDYQMWLTNYNLLFSSDGFKTVRTAIGLLVAPDGINYYGLNTEVLVGQLILGEKLTITNTSGTYTISNNGFNASKNGYTVTINPNTPSEIFKIALNGTNKLYVDATNNELMFNGKLTANAINADLINALNIVATSVKSTWIYAGSINANQITAGTIIADSVKSNWIYTGSISADQITAGTIVADKISGGTLNFNNFNIINLSASNITTGSLSATRISGGTFDASKMTVSNLVVGSNVSMGSNATISWGQISDASTNVTTITRNTVTTSYVNALDITANSVKTTWVYAGNISANQITAGTIDAALITVNNLDINNVKYGTYPVITCTGSTSNPTIYIGKSQSSSSVNPNNINLYGTAINIGNQTSVLYSLTLMAGTITFTAGSTQRKSITTISTASVASVIADKLNDVISLLKGYNFCY